MKKLIVILYFNFVLFMLAGCVSSSNEVSPTDSSENNAGLESTEKIIIEKEENTSPNISKTEEANIDEAKGASTEKPVISDSDSSGMSEKNDSNEGDREEGESLFQYSSEQIEYARVWFQLGANQDIDGLYVRHIQAGTLLNPEDDTSAGYPEDVIQLAGSRLVDGSVTYSGNRDGTINVYNVPLRWDGSYPAGEKFYKDIVDNTQQVYIDSEEEEAIIQLIQLLNVQD